MKTMVMFDLLTVKKLMKSQVLLCLVVALIFATVTDMASGIIPCLAVMFAYSTGFSLVAYDERNNWESLRLTLPLSRANIVRGRYATFALMTLAGIALGAALTAIGYGLAGIAPLAPMLSGFAAGIDWQIAVAMIAAGVACSFVLWTVALPLVARFGMTKAVRYLPLTFLVLIPVGTLVAQNAGPIPPYVMEFAVWAATPTGTLALSVAVVAVMTVLFVLSCALSVKMYQKREF